ncbi:MAG TPA: hypothetical protein DD434_01040 [Bacteroidales bacterium]|mgnify:CR=1 FL=1|nr:hypothetical protein [Bacteroidales bacterium]
MNLVPAINEMENVINKIKNEYEGKLNELTSGLKVLRKLNTVCERCNGTGKIKKPHTCAEDDDDYDITCPVCHGSGKAKYS